MGRRVEVVVGHDRARADVFWPASSTAMSMIWSSWPPSAVVVADTGELAGWAGLSIPTFLPEILPAVEVGWRLGERYRGHGFATEAGRAWVRHGFERLGLESIVSIYEPDNVASGAVMGRLGFTLERETRHPTYGMGIHVMSLSRPT